LTRQLLVEHDPLMQMNRRQFMQVAGSAVATSMIGCQTHHPFVAPPPQSMPIVDAHFHIWDLKHFRLPWLDRAGPLLNRSYTRGDYLAAIEGLNVTKSVYIEVSVAPEQREAEARQEVALCLAHQGPFRAAVIGGTPGTPEFKSYITAFRDSHSVRGVRCSFPAGKQRDSVFLDDLKLLGELRMSFDLLLGPELLEQAAEAVSACPATRFILDHCGNASPAWFGTNAPDASRRARWEAGIVALAKKSNVYCKISGVAEAAPASEASIEQITPIVEHCLEHFGPERVMFASNWPVCLKSITLKQWVEMVKQITASRPEEFRRKLFADNAERWYRLNE
jgi:L-fuconolactonase